MLCWLCRYHSILHGTPQSVLPPNFWLLATSPTRGGGGGRIDITSVEGGTPGNRDVALFPRGHVVNVLAYGP